VGVVIVEGEGAVLGMNLGHPIETNGDFVAWLHLLNSVDMYRYMH